MVDAGMDIVVGKAGTRISKEATKHVTDKVDKQVQENVVETVIDWFKDAAKNINFEF